VLTFAAILVVPWLIGLAVTPLAIACARRWRWLDHPSGRKRHSQPVPILGGPAVFAAVALGLGLLAPMVEPIREGAWGAGSLLALGGGALAMLLLGLYDDRHDLRPGAKLAVQVAVAVATWAAGFQVAQLPAPLDGVAWASTGGSLLLTVGWIVVVANAFNLIDGMDGLACGISVIASLTVFLLANHAGATVPVIGALALAGALAAFLRFNLPPARIFLGDSGALAIGYTTAVLSLASYQKAPTALAMIVPLLVFGLPILDTAISVLRRGLGHVRGAETGLFNPLAIARAVFRADRGHVHHLLLRWGLSEGHTLGVLYALSAGLAALGWWSRSVAPQTTWVLWLALLGLGFAALRRLERQVTAREAARAEREPGAPAKERLAG
jgi:UDP-GlcNAc:undecaprenyl-phosphate GlcNAc-1-phosphate transferase